MRIQIISIIVSSLFLAFIIELTRKEKIHEAYSILWLLMGALFLFLSIFRNALKYFGDLVGIHYSPTALLLALLMGVILILIQYSIVISIQTDKIKRLSQELGLLALQVKELQQAERES
jgi:hypothetical protein